MRVDAVILGAVAAELDKNLTGARIDTVIAPTPHAVALQCYGNGQNRWLLLSAHPQLARIHWIDRKPTKLVTEPSSFVMLLRKYLESGRIEKVAWVQWERIVEITVRQHDEQRSTCIIEVMGNLANIILVDEDRKILGAIHMVGAAVNKYRTILPGHAYLPPPAQTRPLNGELLPRLTMDTVTTHDLVVANAAMFQAEEKPVTVARVLLAQIAGISQDSAAEVTCRALDTPKATIDPASSTAESEWGIIAATLRALADHIRQQSWEPTAILNKDIDKDDDKAGNVVGTIIDGAPLIPCVFAQQPQRRMPTMNDLLAAYFAAREWGDALGGARTDLKRSLRTTHDRLQKKLIALRSEFDALQQASQLRTEGELLLAYASDIPEGVASFTPPDVGDGTVSQPITLDIHATAIENANMRFHRYHKMNRAAAQIPEQISRAEVDLAHVDQLATDLDLADSLIEIAHVREEIAEAHLGMIDKDARSARLPKKVKTKPGQKGKQQKKTHPGGNPLSLKSADGFPLYVGKNSNQNEYVTFEVASGNDLWFHARGVPGAHVVIKSGGRPVDPDTIQQAARLAAWFSQSRGNGSVPVDYTEQKYVRHMKNGGPGMVTYSKEHTLHAVPRAEP